MTDESYGHTALAFLRLQSWLSPSFPNGAYSYSHGLEWAVEAGYVADRRSLIDWLEADLCYGSGRNEAIFFSEAYRCVAEGAEDQLPELAELAAASRGTSEFVLESAQQSSACLTTSPPPIARALDLDHARSAPRPRRWPGAGLTPGTSIPSSARRTCATDSTSCGKRSSA